MSEVLVIDSSTDAIAIACGSSDSDASVRHVEQRAFHSENILVAIDEVIKERNTTMAELDAIGVGIGPGLFTGLRVGITAAHAFAHALDIPLVYFSSLELAALSSCTGSDPVHRDEMIVARDARRHELYSARYVREEIPIRAITIDTTTFSTTMMRISDEELISPSDFVSIVNTVDYLDVYCTNGLYEEFDYLTDDAQTRFRPAVVNAQCMIDHVVQSVAAGIVVDPFSPSALYIRKSDAELSWGILP